MPNEPPLRGSLLQLLVKIQNAMEQLSLRYLPNSARGQAIYALVDEAVKLLNDLASCAEQCRGGDHLIENLVRRFCNYVLAAHRLTLIAYYDEALALIRAAGELANLFRLFALAPDRLASWKAATREVRLDEFKPSHVRSAIVELGGVPVVSREVY